MSRGIILEKEKSMEETWENPEELDSFDEMVMKCYEADRAEEEALYRF